MFARFSTLLLVLSLLNAAFAWAPRTPTSTKPISASDLKLRQNSREKIIQRATAKRARVQIRAIQQEHKDVFGKRIAADPQHSPKVYPKCSGSKGLGYAHYYHWDYYSNDVSVAFCDVGAPTDSQIPGNPRYAEQGGHNTEENCIALCSAHQLTPKKRTPTPDTCESLGSLCLPKAQLTVSLHWSRLRQQWAMLPQGRAVQVRQIPVRR